MPHNETLDVIPLSATPLNYYEKMCNSCTIYIVSFFVFFIASIASVFFIYFLWCLKKDNVSVKFNPGSQKTIY